MTDLIYRCPGCNNNSKYFHMEKVEFEKHISIMCWDICGMDFDVPHLWFFLNSWRDNLE